MLLAALPVGRYDPCGKVPPARGRKAEAMTEGDVGPVGGAVAAAVAPRVKRTIFGPIGLGLSLVPLAFYVAMILLRPG
jgi:hypothetical protein